MTPAFHIPERIRRHVFERARGACEYCRTPSSVTFAPHEIDHIIARKHGGGHEPSNLALACLLCNQLKGSDIASIDPITGDVVPLFNPRTARWSQEFRLAEVSIEGLSPSARATVRLLQLNRRERQLERQQLLVAGLWPGV